MSDAAWRVRPATQADLTAWAQLRSALWPDEDGEPATDHRDDMLEMLAQPERQVCLLAFDERGQACGFAEASLRGDYVNGTDRSPVGFLEGWYVAPSARGRGIGRGLIAQVEAWTLARGCDELASDSLLDNTLAHQAHAACGFEETERVVYFRKALR
ncbi:GNAT family N-acetyltransferase [Lysobacter sp. 5GHs7-4]|uniref:aminoglycoside 6'-N-acetyltransferase n=1 Tax=Lysobacter sp. 5GHs7-4 TaxID=2904253 RepID=UPI001E4D9256|nr:aminoglycoside 6'-N-acetyltransferase [Lysobacter sp. 5GHs7-4]UHQ22370.1 GNAT family N-acetyltransferase [Lysobacter sp. 5GHs7-4]